MTRYPSCISRPAIAILWLSLLCAAGFMLQTVFSAEAPESRDEVQPKIECLLPDGQTCAILRPHDVDPRSSATIIDDTTVSCPLRQGETTFVIALPKNVNCDQLTFVNENAGASGELKIAVSESRLEANSPKWTEIDGIIPFSHKRLFNVSLVGIETKFVRLSFHVDPTSNVADRAASSFQSSALASAINSRFAKVHMQRAEMLLVFESLIASSGAWPNE
ncbi:MAG TPA: hypothetical protein VEI58_09800 [Chthoniobacterales bacterium]|nr:hypothetical protein [Chthoniobacterales bacterium]